MENIKMKKSFFDNFSTPIRIAAAFAAVTVFFALLLFLVSSGSMNIPESLYNTLAVLTLDGSVCAQSLAVPQALVLGTASEAGAVFFMLIGCLLILRCGAVLETVIRGKSEIFAFIDKNCVKKTLVSILMYALLSEALGFVLYMAVFVPAFGFVRSLGLSLFTSVSAFTNCGMSLLPASAEAMFAENLLYETVTVLMLFLGSAGPVFAASALASGGKGRVPFGMKLQMIFFLSLRIAAAVLIAVFEGAGGAFSGLPWYSLIGSSLLASFGAGGASLTCFAYPALTSASRIVVTVVMFTGGLPGSVTGGIRTGAAAVVLLWLFRYPFDGGEIRLKNTSFDAKLVSRAVYIFMLCAFCVFVFTVLFASSGMTVSDALFEAVSSFTLSGIHSADISFDALHMVFSALAFTAGRILPLWAVYRSGMNGTEKNGMRKTLSGSDMVI